MNNFITKIKVNEIFHLKDFDICIDDNKMKHLIITGKNGSGKTVLLNAIVDFFEKIRADKISRYIYYRDQIEKAEQAYQRALVNKDESEINQTKKDIVYYKAKKESTYGKVEPFFDNIDKVSEACYNNQFLFAFYEADRKPAMLEPVNPIKPQLKGNRQIKNTATDQFLYFLSDLKIQEALARNEGLLDEANQIKGWFVEFEKLLKDIFDDATLILKFEYKDYTFHIQTKGRSFKFVELSDGYAAIIEIIADLILKMQGVDGSLSREYNKAGIVVIDEIETHLHLELQRLILPMLTRVFPNIQFIITTHSPFVLSSLENAVAYDLERKEAIEDLTQYSYEALSEGYFGVRSESSYLRTKFNRYKELCKKSDLSLGEEVEKEELHEDFEKIPEAVAPMVIGEFKTINLDSI